MLRFTLCKPCTFFQVELLTGLIEALRALGSMDLTESGQSLPSGDPSRDLERLAPRFPDLVDDPHWKVGANKLKCCCITPVKFSFNAIPLMCCPRPLNPGSIICVKNAGQQ